MLKLLRPTRALAAFAFAGALCAQSNFSGFSPGNIVVTRSVYTGDATTVAVGQALPPICPSTADCGTARATDNGAYASLTSANNVFNNDNADGNFGITSPIFLDQLSPSGSLINTLAIPSNMLTTSFSSKSELSINVSQDGSALTIVGYVAPPNAIDVSNSNTPGVYDPTNPVGSSYFRAVLQIGANGALQVTPLNAYSGNNGRAAVLAGGLYYTVGNDNNGSGTPANVVTSTGVEMAVPGQGASTTPTMIGDFNVSQYTNPATGMPFAADKAGKDNNFRGLTVFNNTLYITKGSGSNGFDTVYQVGAAGSLPTLANAATSPITVLPGFPTVSAKNANAGTIYPFGIWFANATTLYVADEGDGKALDAATSTLAGLQKWSLVSGTWQMDYVLQKGLNLGVPYTVTNYPTSLNPATDGLRNITGKVNGDGTVTIWAVTSTVSANGDQGADPNKLVMITDTLASTTASAAASEQFTVVRSANAGEVLRGVSLTPSAMSTMSNVPLVLSAATTSVATLAPGALASANGQNLTGGFPGPIFGILPTLFDGTSVTIVDSAGKSWNAPLFYVSANEVDFQVPAGVAAGAAKVSINSNTGSSQTASNVQIASIAPAMFTFNNSGLAAAYAVAVSPAGAQTTQLDYSVSGAGLVSANPIAVGSNLVYLTLYGTGFDAATVANTTVTINGVSANVVYAGPGGNSAGLDQVNVLVPASLAGKGNVNVQTTVAGIAANPVQITIQ